MLFAKCLPQSGAKRYAAMLSLAAFLLSACTALSIDLDPEFRSQAELFTVSGRQGLMLRQQLRFGPYHTDIVDRDWNSSSEVQIANYKSQNQRGGFRFTQRAFGENGHHVDCRSRANNESLTFGRPERGQWNWLLNADNRFDCEIGAASTEPRWHLAVGQRDYDNTLSGGLFGPSSHYHINSIHTAQGSAMTMGVIGYQISRDGIIVATLETMNQGRVWLRQDLSASEASLLAAAASALLLYEAPDS
ncbi:hypothetical protein [Zhongshania sp.]|uniref:hypothetical protein n=1 Tax=Zhongshania sp. TaxID=1971902 RepID=UPI003563540A